MAISKRSSWEQFFDAHAEVYDKNVFTSNTLAEVDFVLEELDLAAGQSILDVGCGTGRHAVELARRGYSVTGLDLSAEMLARARRTADAAGVRVAWLQYDASKFELRQRFDGAICLCEGAFGLLGNDDDPIGQPFAILRNISRCLQRGGRLVMTVLNGAAMLRKHGAEQIEAGAFDPTTLTESSAYKPQPGLPEVAVQERGFVGTELTLLCRLAGIPVRHIWGGTAGAWNRRPLDLDEIEIMVVAEKMNDGIDPHTLKSHDGNNRGN